MFRRTPQNESVVKVSEGDGQWADPPRWIEYFISLGFNSPTESKRQRICFVSTPCDSQAAGLIALGVLLRRLSQPPISSAKQHHDNLRTAAKRSRGNVFFRHRTRFGLFEAVIDTTGQVRFRRTGQAAKAEHFLLEPNAVEWAVDGEPHTQLRDLEGALAHSNVYSMLMPDGVMLNDENLIRSDSVVVFAGRPVGSTATRQHLQRLAFRCGSDIANLAELLSINSWAATKISRMRYLTSRKSGDNCNYGRFDRAGFLPRLVVADGAAAFSAATTCAEGADIIAVIDRSSDFQSLEELGVTVSGLRQWYDDGGVPKCAIPTPSGVFLSSLVSKGVP